mgnify:CR=1 FL=1
MLKKPVIIVHGGAGPWEDLERLQPGQIACEAAAQAGQKVLLDGGSALDAVEVAVRVLEDSPALDAGRGSYPNARGEIEMDAMIMDGRTLDIGAVAAVQRMRYPVSLAFLRPFLRLGRFCRVASTRVSSKSPPRILL